MMSGGHRSPSVSRRFTSVWHERARWLRTATAERNDATTQRQQRNAMTQRPNGNSGTQRRNDATKQGARGRLLLLLAPARSITVASHAAICPFVLLSFRSFVLLSLMHLVVAPLRRCAVASLRSAVARCVVAPLRFAVQAASRRKTRTESQLNRRASRFTAGIHHRD